MSTVSFQYKPWDKKVDLAMDRPGKRIGLAAMNGPIMIRATTKESQRDKSNAEFIDGVASVLAGAIEWFREYGMSAEEVQSRVNQALAKDKGTARRAILLTETRKIRDIADPLDQLKRVNAEKVPV